MPYAAAMETAVSAWSNYCHTLMHAPNEWWRNLSQNDDDDEDGTDKDKRRMACGDDHETQSNDGTFATAQEEVGDDIFSSRYLF